MEHRLDPWLALAVIAILGASLPTLHSVSRVVGTNLLLRQLAWGAAGLVILWLLSGIRLDLYDRLAPLAYAAGLLAIGWYYSRRSRTREDYLLGSRRMKPLMVGLSRKSMIWRTLQVTPGEALTGTVALHMTALMKGASILRAHDVREAREVIALYEKIYPEGILFDHYS